MSSKNRLSKIGKEYDSSEFTRGLVNYWTFDESLNDVVNGQNMTINLNGAFTSDRFKNKNSALTFYKGHGNFPSGYYLNKEFTLMFWIKTLSYNQYQAIVEFGNDLETDIVFIGFENVSGQVRIIFIKKGDKRALGKSGPSDTLPIGKWVHVAVNYKNEQVLGYIDGVLKIEFKTADFISKIRSFNFIGKSHWPDENLHADLDDLKIFDRVLSKQEIKTEKEKTTMNSFGQLLHISHQLKSYSRGLIHYWLMAGSTRDIIGGKDLQIISQCELTKDRFQNKNSGKLL